MIGGMLKTKQPLRIDEERSFYIGNYKIIVATYSNNCQIHFEKLISGVYQNCIMTNDTSLKDLLKLKKILLNLIQEILNLNIEGILIKAFNEKLLNVYKKVIKNNIEFQNEKQCIQFFIFDEIKETYCG